jgi:hypothetical protein
VAVRHSSQLAAGSYIPKSRDMRGIGMSFKITPEASSPVNKGPPAFGAERSVKPSAQPTLVRTQHPPSCFPIYISEFDGEGFAADSG